MSAVNRTHGFSINPTTRALYGVWGGMKARCYDEKREDYKNYGARGVTICKEWLANPGEFIRWAIEHGWQRGLEIDRRENDKGYSPSNCRIVTRLENQRNKRAR